MEVSVGRGMRRSPFLIAALTLTLSAACIGPDAADPRPLLDRIAYGPSPDDANRIRAIGARAFIEEQLHPESIDDSAFEARLASYPTVGMSLADIVSNQMSTPDVPMLELIDAKILRAAYSRRQLEAILTDFWFNHFHVRDAGITVGSYERDVVRAHVFGRFEDMLLAVARSPAMAIYLNNMENIRDGLVVDGVERGTNENYGRELLELHTVGLAAGYTQQDVIALARCFTGWNIDFTTPDGFTYIDWLHDKNPKQVMGLAIGANGGEDDGRRALTYLAAHPSTAAQIARKLVRRFVDENPPAALVDAATDTFLRTGGDLREVMRTILLSDEFLARPPRTKLKRPMVLIASTIRALRLEIQDDVEFHRSYLWLLGELPYYAGDPRGYSENSSQWLAPGALLSRLEFVRLAAERAKTAGLDLGGSGSEPSLDLINGIKRRLSLALSSSGTLQPIVDYAEWLGVFPAETRAVETAGLLLSSPEFQYH
jgi:uncharacterized protein (DUF1800 family)